MTGLLRRLDAAFRAPAPAERLAMVRVLVGAFATGFLLVRAGHLARLDRFEPAQFEPVGLAQLLSAPLPTAALYALVVAGPILGALFVVGYRFGVVGPLFAALVLFMTSYRSSFGMLFHTDNLLALDVMILAVTPAADALTLQGRAERAGQPHARYGWPLRLLCLVTALTYFVAGVAKVRNGGFEWASGEVLLVHIAYDSLRKIQVGALYSPFGTALVGQPWVFAPLATASLVLELGAPLFLLRRRLAQLWCLGVWAFHLGVQILMFIGFPFPLSGVAFTPFFRVERLLERRWPRRLVRAFAKDLPPELEQPQNASRIWK